MPSSFTPPEHSFLKAQRTRLAKLEAKLTANQNKIKQRETRLSQAVRQSKSGKQINALNQQLETARKARRDLLKQKAEFNASILDRLSETFPSNNLENAFSSLEGSVPVAMLPVRLETRFSGTGAKTKLRIRVYPDQVHIDAHTPALLPVEIEMGKRYWAIRKSEEEAKAREAWVQLGRQFQPTRASWIVEQLKPENFDADDDELVFPTVEERLDSTATVPQATLLPNRWVAVGLNKNGDTHTEVFRKWGAVIPDALNVSLSFDDVDERVEEDDQLPVDKPMFWTVDYDEAERVGMAVTVELEDLNAGQSLAPGVDLLVVMGVDWTFTPEESADRLSALLGSHKYSDGIAFVPQGVPTNNTGPERSGFTTDPVEIARNADPLDQPTELAEDCAISQLSKGLGLNADDANLANIPFSSLCEQEVVSLLFDVLWESTLGYYLDEILDPHATDATIDAVRTHVFEHLYPFGPYSAFRCGKQPYGIIPVMASGGFSPDQADGFEDNFFKLLRRLQWYWQRGVNQVPFMGKQDNPDDDLLALLQLNPYSVAWRFRKVFDGETASNLQGITQLAEVQTNIMQHLVVDQANEHTTLPFNVSRLTNMVANPTDLSLFGPWVQEGVIEAGSPLTPNYIQQQLEQLDKGLAGRLALDAHTDSKILLEALIAHAALRELDRASSKAIDTYLVETGELAELPPKSTLQTRSLTGIGSIPDIDASEFAFIETPEQQAHLIIPAITKSELKTMADFVSEKAGAGEEESAYQNLTGFRQSLAALAEYPTDQIDRCLRGVLDCYSHRLDAWLTSVASRRLKNIRAERPEGVYTGGYGWVENLRPDMGPDSLGYVHAPSIDHAATAAILRSGHLSHRGRANVNAQVSPNAPEAALNIDLSSDRVRLALNLLEGVSRGQSLAVLLGYRFERGLRERDLKLAQFIHPIRRLAPFTSALPDIASGPAEGISARNVVDGLKLLERWRANRVTTLNGIKDPVPNASQKQNITIELDRLEEMLDAVSDVLLSESVYQMVRGNYQRAGAAIAALDRQERPPEPQFVKTSRTGESFQQRVITVLQSKDLPATWNGVNQDPRALIEPRLNAWIARLIGAPKRIKLAARVHVKDQDPIDLNTTLHQFLSKEFLSPLSLVLMSEAASGQAPSELEQRLAAFFAGQVNNPDPEMTLELLSSPPKGFAAGAVAMGELFALLKMIYKAISKRRGADARDFMPAEGIVSSNIDIEDLKRRLRMARALLSDREEKLTDALADSLPKPLHKALVRAAQLGLRDAYPFVADDDPEAVALLAEQAGRIRDRMREKISQLDTAQEAFDDQEDVSDEAHAAHLIAQLRVIFGEAFPVFPLFKPHNVSELRASKQDRSSLLGDDDFAPLTWLQQMGTVRPEVEKYVTTLTASEMLGTAHKADSYGVIQLPHVDGQSWVGTTLPAPPADPLLSIVTIGYFDLGKSFAGIVCDGWNEIIPSATETTGISFHYDAPGTRAPQSIILAVPPDVNQESWSFEKVFDTILHTLDLAKMRVVGPKELPVLGGRTLPMIYLPQDDSRQIPSINLAELYTHWKDQTLPVIGKMNSHDSE